MSRIIPDNPQLSGHREFFAQQELRPNVPWIIIGISKELPMATLYVENVPDHLYAALRDRAKKQHRSIAAEVLSLLELHIPTKKELRARGEAFRKLEQLRFTRAPSAGSFPSSEEMIREDRER
jgi:plasmid stability protein